MDIPGFTYDKKTGKYYKTPPASSSSYLNLPITSDDSSSKVNQVKLEQKIDCTLASLANLEYGQNLRGSKSGFKFNAYDSLIATRFTNDKFKFNRNILIQNLLDFNGASLVEPYCRHLVALPIKDLLFGVWKNEKSNSIVQINVKNLLAPSSTNYKLIAKNYVEHYSNAYLVEQILPIPIIRMCNILINFNCIII